MTLQAPRPGQPGVKDWMDLADAFDALGIAAAGGLVRKKSRISDEQMRAMVDRFLSWRLPDTVHPDCGSVRHSGEPVRPEDTGTNLLTAIEARQMLEHVLCVYVE